MASNSDRKSKRYWLPGCVADLSIRDLENIPNSNVKESVSPSNQELYIPPVQDWGSHRSSENYPTSPVSESVQMRRDQFRKSGNGPVLQESSQGLTLKETKDNLKETTENIDFDAFALVTDFAMELSVQTDSENNSQSTMISPTHHSPPQIQIHSPYEADDVTVKNGAECYLLNCDESPVIQETQLSSVKIETDSKNSQLDSDKSFFIHDSQLSSYKIHESHFTSSDKFMDTITSEHFQDLIRGGNFGMSLSSATPSHEDSADSVKGILNSFVKKLMNDHDSKDIPSYSAYILLRNCSSFIESSQLSSLLAPFGFHTDEELKCILEAQCYEDQCSESCLQIQDCLMKLRDDKMDLNLLTDQDKIVLYNMYSHCCSCKYLRCPLYWCQKNAIEWPPFDLPKIITNMKQLVEHGYHGNFLQELKNGTFYKLFQNLPFENVPREGEDWSGIIRMPDAKNTIFASPTNFAEEGEYWIIKKCPMFKSRSQIDLYKRLRKMSHKGIALHLWASFLPDMNYMAVCTRFEAFSLYDRLQESPITDLNLVVELMMPLISTTRHLHDKGILYLNWSSKNILFDYPEMLKLSNFTCSAFKSRIPDDIKDITASLPRHLLAPEMLEDNPDADEFTDVWGLGCLLKEIFSGQPVWYEWRHETVQVLHEKVLEKKPLRPDGCRCRNLIHTFKACWEEKRSERPSLEELENFLI